MRTLIEQYGQFGRLSEMLPVLSELSSLHKHQHRATKPPEYTADIEASRSPKSMGRREHHQNHQESPSRTCSRNAHTLSASANPAHPRTIQTHQHHLVCPLCLQTDESLQDRLLRNLMEATKLYIKPLSPLQQIRQD